MSEEMERTLGRILASQEATERRLTGIEGVLSEFVRLEERQIAHQTDDDRRIEALQKDIDRAHAKAEENRRNIASATGPKSKAKTLGTASGLVSIGTGIGVGIMEWLRK